MVDNKVDYKALDELCRQNIEFYDELVGIAWGLMDRMRCPLWMALPTLYDRMVGVLEDNDIDCDELNIEEIISC